MKLHLGTGAEPLSFNDLVNALPDKEFRRDTRSTVALLAWWKGGAQVAALAERLGWRLATEATARFEHREPPSCSSCPGKGKGGSSATDVMLDLGDDVVAIEAKRTEPLYGTVKAWFDESPTENRQAVLAHWVRCCLSLDAPLVTYDDLEYQIVHRAASARRLAGSRRAHVVHLLFGDHHADEYIAASKRAAELLAPSGEPRFHVVVVPVDEAPAFKEVLAAAERAGGGDRVRNALLQGDPIFTFGPPSIR